MPKITVFITAYNAAQYISDAINSILSQTYTDFELLIIDDGSTDETNQIISSYSDSRIRLIKNDKNRGLVYSRNLALSEARGKYLAILDSDDIAHENRLEIQLKEFENRPNLALLGTPANIINSKGERTGEIIKVKHGKDNVSTQLFFENTFVHSSVMLQASVFRYFGGYQNHPLAEDYDLIARIALSYEVDNLKLALVDYRKHDNNISTIQQEKLQAELYPIKEKQLAQINIALTPIIYEVLSYHPIKTNHNLLVYEMVISKIMEQNNLRKVFPSELLNKKLFIIWFEAILYKSSYKAFPLLFRKKIFSWDYVTFKQIRKTFKLSLKSILGISNNKS